MNNGSSPHNNTVAKSNKVYPNNDASDVHEETQSQHSGTKQSSMERRSQKTGKADSVDGDKTLLLVEETVDTFFTSFRFADFCCSNFCSIITNIN